MDNHLQEILAWIADNELETGSDDDDDEDLDMDEAIDTITTTAKSLCLLLTVGTRDMTEDLLQSAEFFEGIA